MLDGREVVLLCSNDYLGLAGDPRLRGSRRRGRASAGAPERARRSSCRGHMTIHRELEERLAELKGYEACVLFGSGFLANTGVIAALATDGVVASRRAQPRLDRRRLPAGASADARLPARRGPGGRRRDRHRRRLLDGRRRRADCDALVETGARVIVDEAHATGVIGPEGRGLVHELGLQDHVITIGTLGKALGSYGAFVCCDRETADYLVNRARTMIYSTALPPPSIGAALKRARPDGPRARRPSCTRTRASLREALGVEVNDMPIVPLIIGDPDDAMAACEAALRAGLLRPGHPPADRPGGHLAAARSSPPPPTIRDCARPLDESV